MEKKTIVKILILIWFILIVRCSTGIYKDDEFSDYYFFVKHILSWQFYFEIKPDKRIFYDSLIPMEKSEIDTYDEFIENKIFYIYLY